MCKRWTELGPFIARKNKQEAKHSGMEIDQKVLFHGIKTITLGFPKPPFKDK